MPVRLRVVGRSLTASLRRAFAHLESDDPGGPPFELDVALWDAARTGLSPPGGRLAAEPDDEERFSRSSDDTVIVQWRSQSVFLLDRPRGRILGCAAYGDHGPLLHELGKPLQQLLGVWYFDRDIPLMHAGLVARHGRGILIGGAGGAGKSTTSVACLLGGFDFLGDDRVGLEKRGGSFVGHSIFGSTMMFADHLARFAPLRRHAVAPRHAQDRKPVVFLAEACGERMARSVQIEAVVLPRFVSGRRDSLTRPAPKAATLLSIAPSSVVFPLGPGRAGMTRAADLLRAAPGYFLETGEDLSAIPDCLGRLLDEVEAA